MKHELAEIKKIRADNNDLWMMILKIALEHAPEETKGILSCIRANDQMISDRVGDICDADSE